MFLSDSATGCGCVACSEADVYLGRPLIHGAAIVRNRGVARVRGIRRCPRVADGFPCIGRRSTIPGLAGVAFCRRVRCSRG